MPQYRGTVRIPRNASFGLEEVTKGKMVFGSGLILVPGNLPTGDQISQIIIQDKIVSFTSSILGGMISIVTKSKDSYAAQRSSQVFDIDLKQEVIFKMLIILT